MALTSRVESTRQSHAPASVGSRARKPTYIDALRYVFSVKETFRETPYKFQMFLDVLKDYAARRVDVADVISRMTDLFEGHEDLLFGFNAFVPDPYTIDFPRV